MDALPETLCHEIKRLCYKSLENSEFLFFVNKNAALVIRAEMLALNATVNMVEVVFGKAIKAENGQESLFYLGTGGTSPLLHQLEACEENLSAALKLAVPDTKATNLANLLCRAPYLSPSTTLFNAAIRELQELRWHVSEALKGTIASRFNISDPLRPVADTAVRSREDRSASRAQDPDVVNLVKAQNHLLAQLWLGLPHQIAEVRRNLSPNAWESTERLDAKLRDTLVRRLTSRYMMVFVGAQSSGKSTFLNAFIGKELLPTHGTQSTTYPCRIRHVFGKTVPELYLPKSLEIGLSCLRQLSLLEKYQGYISEPRTWTGSDLPTHLTAEGLSTAWERTDDETQANFHIFMDPAFSFPSIVYGEQILEWMHKLNDLTVLCRTFGLPFQAFLFDDWALIQCDFLGVSQAPADDFCEIVDIPGLDNQHSWDDVIQEVIRRANAIVAVVSVANFGTSSHASTAALISKTTALPVAAVILTKIDAVRRDEIPTSTRTIARTFWKSDGNTEPYQGLVLPCSIIVTNGASALLSLIEQQGTKPPFDTMKKMPFVGYFGNQPLDIAKTSYNALTLEELKQGCEDRKNKLGVATTFRELRTIIGRGVGQQHLSELVEITKELHLLKQFLQPGHSAGHAITPEPLAMTAVESQAILQEWSVLRKGVQEEAKKLITTYASPVALEVRSKATEAIHSSLEKVLHSATMASPIYFEELQDLHTFIAGVQLAFSTSQTEASQKAASQFFEQSRARTEAGVSLIQESIASLQSPPYKLVQPPWPVEPTLQPPTIQDLLEKSEALQKDPHIRTFQEWRRQIEYRLYVALRFPKPDSLLMWQRYLITLAAALTFPTRHIVGRAPFVLNVEKLESALEEIGARYCDSTMDVLRQEFHSENDPIWDAARLAIIMGLAGIHEKEVAQGPIASSPVLRDSLEKVGTAIDLNLGWLSSLTTALKPVPLSG